MTSFPSIDRSPLQGGDYHNSDSGHDDHRDVGETQNPDSPHWKTWSLLLVGYPIIIQYWIIKIRSDREDHVNVIWHVEQ